MLALAVFLAIRIDVRRIGLLRFLRDRGRRLAHRPWLACLLLVGVCLGLNLCLTMIRYPLPWVHDEFSYLLAARTFAEGRLTNPRHELWEHFETFHVLSDPGYMSKYPPASSLFMAAGQWLTGHPIVGAWLALALASAAMYWMLRAWTSPHWALLGGALVAASAPLIRAWGQTYWGGSVALLGGALVFGGLRRICDCRSTPCWRDASAVGCGAVLLANSRPMEGFLACLPVAVCLLVWLAGSPAGLRWQRTIRVALPLLAIGGSGLVAMGVYNQQVTGDPLLMPYRLHDRTYSQSSLVVWRELPEPPQYNHPRMEQFYRQWGRDRQQHLRTASGYLQNLHRKLNLLWNFLPIGMGWSLIPLFFLWRYPWWRLALVTVAGVLLVHAQLATSWMYPHYLAPVLALFLAVNIECLRHLAVWHRTRRLGRTLTRVVLVLAILKLVPMFIDWHKPLRPHPRQWVHQQLQADPAPQHLVIVSYGDDYRIVDDWVYNHPDIDASPVVWARHMGEAKNEQLVEYFPDRKIWRWHLDGDDQMTLQESALPSNRLAGPQPVFSSCPAIQPAW